MVDSSPSSSGVPQLGAAPASKAGAAPSRSHAGSHAHGRAHGSDAIEIFTSFHALVDAIADDKRAAAKAQQAGGTHADAHAEPGDAAGETDNAKKKDDTPTSVVMPLEIAALLLPNTFGCRSFNLGGDVHTPAALAEGSVLAGSAGDELARVLLGIRGNGLAGADNLPADDTADPNAALVAAARQGLPLGADAGQTGEGAEGDVLAQAVIQRLLAAAANGSQKVAGDLAASKGSHTQQIVDDLLRQIAAPSDRVSSNGVSSAAARLVSQHIGDVTTSAAPAFAAEVASATNTLLEAPSTSQLDSIVQTIRLQWSNGGGEAQIRLEPHHFGELSVSVRVDQGQVVARLQAETPAVREWLHANQQALRQSLADHNLTLARLEVSEPGDARPGTSRQGQQQHDEQEQRPSRRHRTPDSGETFEVVA